MNNSKMIVAVHDGKFHCDEILAITILNMTGFEFDIIRTRNPELLAKADARIDVGGKFDPQTWDFDHHMVDCPLRSDGKKFAAGGLVWQEFGRQVISRLNLHLTDNQIENVWELIDSRFVRPVDLADNGQGIIVEDNLSLMSIVGTFNPPADASASTIMAAFNAAKDWVATAFRQFCETTIQDVLDMDLVAETAKEAISSGSPIWVLPKAGLPWLTWLKKHWEEAISLKVVVFPDPSGDNWRVQTLPGDPVDTFKQRCPAPAELAGKRNVQWQGFDIVFIHPGRFIGGVKGNKATAKDFAGTWINHSND